MNHIYARRRQPTNLDASMTWHSHQPADRVVVVIITPISSFLHLLLSLGQLLPTSSDIISWSCCWCCEAFHVCTFAIEMDTYKYPPSPMPPPLFHNHIILQLIKTFMVDFSVVGCINYRPQVVQVDSARRRRLMKNSFPIWTTSKLLGLVTHLA